jgi:hypothetical protein
MPARHTKPLIQKPAITSLHEDTLHYIEVAIHTHLCA